MGNLVQEENFKKIYKAIDMGHWEGATGLAGLVLRRLTGRNNISVGI